MAESIKLGGEGGNAFPFDQIGAQVTGRIVDLEEVQQTDLDSGQPSFWPDGKPKMMYRVTLSTALRDPADPADDGNRTIYLRGSVKAESQSSLAAVIGAVRQATGGQDIRVGGTLTVQYIGDGQASQRGFNPPKKYAAAYQAPAVTLGQQQPQPNAWDGQRPQQQPPVTPAPFQQPQQQPPVTQAPFQQPVQQPLQQAPAPQPATNGTTVAPEAQAALAALGITPEQLAALAAQNAAAATAG